LPVILVLRPLAQDWDDVTDRSPISRIHDYREGKSPVEPLGSTELETGEYKNFVSNVLALGLSNK
jgi:hypothetical protein